MRNIIKHTAITLLTIASVGCASTTEIVKPRAYDANASKAYNIANQTSLIRNESPLRDLTKKEIEDISASVEQHSGGDTSILFGTLSMFTGNLTGVIDVVGGSAANLANSDHTAAYSRWFAVIPKSDVVSESEAWVKAASLIRQAQIETYSQYGKVETKFNRSGSEYLTLTVGERTIPFGASWDKKTKPEVIDDGDNYLINYTTTGFSQFIQPSSALSLYVHLEQLDIKPNEVYESVSKNLPNGYYLYIPSFEKHYFNDGAFIDLFHKVPAIYTQGKKYEFIKPE